MLSNMCNYLVLLNFFLYFSCALTCIITNWSQSRDLDNLRLTTNIGLLTTPTSIACAVECATILPCMSYSYHARNKTCLLYSIPFTLETTGAVSEGGWQTYNSMCGNCPRATDYFYKRNLNMCYHLESDEVKNINDAIRFCSDYGRMLRINTAEKQAHIVEFLTSRSSGSVYIGGSSEKHDDLFVYEDGTPLTTFFWSSYGNPRKQYAIRLKKNDFVWINRAGNFRRPFLCEISP